MQEPENNARTSYTETAHASVSKAKQNAIGCNLTGMDATTDQSAQTERSPNVPIRLWVLNALVFGLAYGPLASQFFINQWARPQYQYFPFVVGAFIWLFWRNVQIAKCRMIAPGRMQYKGPIFLLATAWVLLGVAYATTSPWLGMISVIVLIGAYLLRLSLQWTVKYLFGLWLMLWLIVPLPLNRDQQLISSLQHLSSRLSSFLLDSVGVEHLMEGNTLLLPGKQFFVDEACSGIVSVLSVIACAVIYGIWRNRNPMHVVILAICGIGWATLMNVGRIATIAMTYDYASIDWSTGTSHELLGLVSFALVFLMLICTDLFLVGLLAPIAPALEEFVGTPSQIGINCIKVWDWMFTTKDDTHKGLPRNKPPFSLSPLQKPLFGYATLTAFALFPLFQFMQYVRSTSAQQSDAKSLKLLIDRALACNRTTLPQSNGALTLVNFTEHTRDRTDRLGNYSRTFEYHDSHGSTLMASCDFPYDGGWHELTVCYTGIGWDLVNRQVVDEPADANGNVWHSLEADFQKPNGDHAFLVASAFSNTGHPLELPTNSFLNDIWRKLSSSWTDSVFGVGFQVQVWVTSPRPFDNQQRVEARALLQTSRSRFYDKIILPIPRANTSR